MRWLFAVVFPVLLASRTAAACPPEPSRCDAATRVVPVAGATAVPRNAWIWISGSAPWVYELSDGTTTRKIEPTMYTQAHAPVIGLRPTLQPGKRYTLSAGDRVATSFEVGATIDITPPASPAFNERELQLVDEQLVLSARVDDDTALVRVELEDQFTKHSRAFLASASDLRAGCALPYRIAPTSQVCVTLTAIDVAANESAPVRHCMVSQVRMADHGRPIEVTLVHLAPPSRDDPSAMIAIALVIALLVGVFMAFAPEIDMGWLRRRSVGHELLPAAARQLARLTLRAAVLRTVLVSAAITPLVAFVDSPAVWFAGLGAALIVARQLWLFVRARHMLALLAQAPDAAVTLHGDHVLRVAANDEIAWLVCSPRQLAVATDRVLPTARVIGGTGST